MGKGAGKGQSSRGGAEGKDGLLAEQPLPSSTDPEDAAAMREDSPLVTFIDESSPVPSHHPSYSWRHASMIIVGEVLGTGIMGLPSAMIPLGWVLGMLSIVVFASTAIYSGVLLSRVRAMYPTATGYADLAHRLGGLHFGVFTNCCILFNWSFLLPYYLMACANGLVIAMYDTDACYWQWALLVIVFLLPAAQIRTLHGLRHAATASDVVVVICLLVILVKLVVSPTPLDTENPTEPLTTTWPHPTGWLDYGSVASFVFAYQGQSMFLEIMKEMRTPAEFGRSVVAANGGMMLVYAVTVGVAYGSHGRLVAGFLPASLPDGMAKRLVGLGLCYHIAVSYLLCYQPLGEKIHSMIWPDTANPAHAEGRSSDLARYRHLVISVAFLIGAFFVANIIPFFSDFQNIIGSACGAPIVFGWPPYFYLTAMRQHGKSVPLQDLVFCRLCLFVALPLCFGVGLTSAFTYLIDSWETYGHPFDCKLVGYA